MNLPGVTTGVRGRLRGAAIRAAKAVRRRMIGVGTVDRVEDRKIVGWAVAATGEGVAEIGLFDGRTRVSHALADLERKDVAKAGAGPLRCGFELEIPLALRDGRTHDLRVLRLPDRARLAGGEITLQGGGAGAELQGRAWLEPRIAAVRGWASGVDRVLVAFDGAPARAVPLTEPVPGFGAVGPRGFTLPVPDDLRDGRAHDVHVVAGPDAAPLDGTPLQIRVDRSEPVVEIVALGGRDLTMSVTRNARPVPADDLRVEVDGAPAALAPGPGGTLGLSLPHGGRRLRLATAADDRTLARFDVDGAAARPQPIEARGAGALRPDPDECAAARAGFADFCAAPDDRFDPLWYAWSQPELDPAASEDAILAHYRDVGAPAGASPGPRFSEALALARNPGVADAVAAGDLPCAFALELHRGAGHLGADPAELAVPTVSPADSLRAARLRPPAAAQAPSEGIYAAWLSRLSTTAERRAEIDADEARARRDIAAAPLDGPPPLVSIVMPTWNRAFTIGEAIQSVLEQSYPHWELLVCDDASEDRTAEVVRGFADRRIRYMRFLKSNGAGARNRGLARARGEVIAYLDSDNVWHPHFLDMMVRALADGPGAAIAYCAYLDTEIVGAELRLAEIPRPAFKPVRLAARNFMDLNTIVHRREVYDALGGFDAALPRLQDWDLALRYTAILRPRYVDRIGVLYRRNVAWGQVTMTQVNAGTQDVVRAKTRRREAGEVERMRLDWAARPRATVLAGPDPASGALAAALAAGLAGTADTDLLAGEDVPADLRADPVAFGAAFAPLLRGRPVIVADGPAARAWLDRVPGLSADRTLLVGALPDGRAALQSLRAARGGTAEGFDLGALPIDLPDRVAGARDVLLAVPGALPDHAPQVARRIGSPLLVLQGTGGATCWTRLSPDGTSARLDWAAGIAATAQAEIAASLAPLSQLPPFHHAVLAAAQGGGRLVAVPPGDGAGMADDWIEAKAAYPVMVPTLDWLGEKIEKIRADRPTLERIVERGVAAHAIVLHRDLVAQRLAYALYRLVQDARGEAR